MIIRKIQRNKSVGYQSIVLIVLWITYQLIVISEVGAQCPTVGFTIDSEYCLGENVIAFNGSMSANSYEWDFCGQAVDSIPTGTDVVTVPGVSTGFGLDYVVGEEGLHAFVTSSDGGEELFRVDFGGSTSSVDSVVSLGKLVDAPSGVEVFKRDGNWYGILLSRTGSVYRLDFDSGLMDATLTAHELTGITSISDMRGVEVVESNDTTYAILAGSNRIQVLRFGNGLMAAPDLEMVTTISGAVFGSGLSMFNDCGVWYGLFSTFSGGIYHLSFSSGLLSSPNSTSLSSGSFGGASLVFFEGEYYGFATQGGSLVRFDFGAGLSNSMPASTNLGNLGVIGTSIGFEIFRTGGNYGGLGMEFGGSIYNIDFAARCNFFSTEANPSGISYSTSGDYDVTLYAKGLDGSEQSLTRSIKVLNATGPDIDFTSSGVCANTTTSFTSTNTSGGITNYDWDFNGEGTSTDVNPDFIFTGIGDKIVNLTVRNNLGCSNQVIDTVTILSEPGAPTFTTAGSLCTNTAITFNNTTNETGFNGQLTYVWDFSAEGSSTSRDTSYVFSTPGSKTIKLQSFIPGCSSPITESDLLIIDGPEVSYSYTNNCFGDDIRFVSQIIGSYDSLGWDFGDGTLISGVTSPTHRYLAADSYNVSLHVFNSSGCETIAVQVVQVNDQALTNFAITGELEENQTLTFSGSDLTLNSDSVVSWIWDFGGLGSSSSQNPTFSFSSSGDYSITLTVQTAQGCASQVTKDITIVPAQCPTVDFTIDSEYCLGENITVSNGSLSANSYEWDFCGQAVDSIPTGTDVVTVPGVSTGFGLDYVVGEEGLHAFVTSSDGGEELFRVDFGGSTSSVDSVVSLGKLVDAPSGVEVFKRDGNWYGILLSRTGSVYRLDFDSGLMDATLTAHELTGITSISDMRGVEVVESNDTTYAILAGSNRIQVLRFGNGLMAAPDLEMVTTISGAVFGSGLSMFNDCGVWYGLFSTFSGGIYHLSFSSGLLSSPNSTSLSSGSFGGASLVFFEGEYYGFATQGGSLVRFDFGAGLSNSMPASTNLGNLGVIGTSIGFEIFRTGGNYGGLGMEFGGSIYNIDFAARCNFFSTEANPSGISYSTSGDYDVTLYAKGLDGSEQSLTRSIKVLNEVAPDIDFSSINRCVSSSNSFTPISANAGIISYKWDFNNDGFTDNTTSTPTHTFGTTGTYPVTLEVSNASCSNRVIKDITIYPVPPNPSFSFSSSEYCENADFQLTNNTDDTAFDGNLSYSWTVAESGQNFVGKDPTLNISQSGTVSFQAQTSIPGCVSETISQALTIIESPHSDFSGSLTCESEITTFANLSEGASGYFWDFGNDFISTQTNPDVIYATAGEYQVSLTATNSSGCFSTKTDIFKVEANPVAGFQLSLPCEAQVTLIDTSTVANSSLSSWEWLVDGELVTTDFSPKLPIDDPGSYRITAVVRSSAGCRGEVTNEITVLDAAEVDFSIEATCDGTPFSIGDNSLVSESNQIIARTWDVNGTFYEDSSFLHDFEGPGDYPIRLVVTTENLCTATIEDTITVLTAPDLAFELDEVCQNTLVSIDDNTLAFDDTIASRSWHVNDQLLGNGDSFIHMFTESGNNELTLTVSTASGCEYVLSKEVDVLEASQALFESNTSFGGPGTDITFNDLSANSDSSIWFINDEQIQGGADLTRVFADPGSYEVSLLSFSSMGCADTTSMEVLIREPEVDLIIQEIVLVEQDDNFSSVLISVANQSNLPVDNLRFTIQVEDQLPTQDRINQFIGIGESRVIELDAGVPNLAEYLCVQVASPYESDDISPGDNEICLNVEPEVIIEPPFPNPARDQTTVRTIIPVEGDVTVSLLNVSGKVEVSETFQDLAAGLHSFPVILAPYEAGMYFLKIEYAGITEIIRIIKQ